MSDVLKNPSFLGWVYHVGAADFCDDDNFRDNFRREAMDPPRHFNRWWEDLYNRWDFIGRPSCYTVPEIRVKEAPLVSEPISLVFTIIQVVIHVRQEEKFIRFTSSSPAISMNIPCLGNHEQDMALIRRMGWTGPVSTVFHGHIPERVGWLAQRPSSLPG